MNYRSRLRVQAWQVNFEDPLPAWLAKESEASRVLKKGWADSLQWFDVYCVDEDIFSYALSGDWILLDEGGCLRCMSNETFALLFEPDL